MNMKPHHWMLALLCGTLFATSSLAEAQTAEEPPWYEIEIIIFTRDLQPASLNEEWPTNPGTPDFDNARPLQRDPADEVQSTETAVEGGIDDLNSNANLNLLTSPEHADERNTLAESSKLIADLPTPDTTAFDPPKPQPSEPYALLLEEDFKLKTEFNRLQRSRHLKPEIHLAWRQPVTGKKSAQLLYLRTPFAAIESKTEIEKEIEAEIAAEAAMGTEIFTGFKAITEADPPSLEGTIRISVKRYLHVELDLLSHIRPPPPFVPHEQSFDGTLTEQAQTDNSYRMQAHRRMRSNELHYIDHPLMGVLIKITPYELPEEIPAKPVASEAKPSNQAEETGRDISDKAAEQEPTPATQEPGTTRSTMEIPAKRPTQ